MKSKRGIYYNLDDSTYYVDLINHRFFFSSPSYLAKFKARKDDYVKFQSNKDYLRIGIYLEDIIYLNQLYKLIEKRGFRIEKIK